MRSKCCNARLQLLREFTALIPKDEEGGIHNDYRCSKCGLVYCLKPKGLKPEETLDEWE